LYIAATEFLINYAFLSSVLRIWIYVCLEKNNRKKESNMSCFVYSSRLWV